MISLRDRLVRRRPTRYGPPDLTAGMAFRAVTEGGMHDRLSQKKSSCFHPPSPGGLSAFSGGSSAFPWRLIRLLRRLIRLPRRLIRLLRRLIRFSLAAHPLQFYFSGSSASSASSFQRLIRSPALAAHPLYRISGSSALPYQRLIRFTVSAAHPLRS